MQYATSDTKQVHILPLLYQLGLHVGLTYRTRSRPAANSESIKLSYELLNAHRVGATYANFIANNGTRFLVAISDKYL